MANLPNTFDKYLQQTPHLNALCRKAEEQAALSEKLLPVLPENLQSRVTIIQQDECLVLLAANNAVAQMLRFYRTALLDASRCIRLRIRIVADAPVLRQPHPVERYMSAKTGKLLRSLADNVADKELAAAVRRLASHAEDSPEKKSLKDP